MKKKVVKVPVKDSKLEVHKRHVMCFSDGGQCWFQQGGKDMWFAAFDSSKGVDLFATDKEMMEYLEAFQELHGGILVSHLWNVYSLVKTRFEVPSVIPIQDDWDKIMGFAQEYGNEVADAERIFGYVYFVMIAEEHFPNTKFGKRIKMLGILQVLVGKMTPEKASKWSCCGDSGMTVGKIRAECDKWGIWETQE